MTKLRTQSRLASFIEAVANTVIGFCISVTAQWFMFLMLGIKATPAQFIWLSLAMTVLSVGRSYVLRRMWNSEFWLKWKRERNQKEILNAYLEDIRERTALGEREWRKQYECNPWEGNRSDSKSDT